MAVSAVICWLAMEVQVHYQLAGFLIPIATAITVALATAAPKLLAPLEHSAEAIAGLLMMFFFSAIGYFSPKFSPEFASHENLHRIVAILDELACELYVVYELFASMYRLEVPVMRESLVYLICAQGKLVSERSHHHGTEYLLLLPLANRAAPGHSAGPRQAPRFQPKGRSHSEQRQCWRWALVLLPHSPPCGYSGVQSVLSLQHRRSEVASSSKRYALATTADRVSSVMLSMIGI